MQLISYLHNTKKSIRSFAAEIGISYSILRRIVNGSREATPSEAMIIEKQTKAMVDRFDLIAEAQDIWQGAIRKVEEKAIRIIIDRSDIPHAEVIAYLNEKAATDFRGGESDVALICTRWRQGATLEDFKLVIDYKVKEWAKPKPGQQDMRQWLRPKTLFAEDKWDGYLSAARTLHKPKRKVEFSWG